MEGLARRPHPMAVGFALPCWRRQQESYVIGVPRRTNHMLFNEGMTGPAPRPWQTCARSESGPCRCIAAAVAKARWASTASVQPSSFARASTSGAENAGSGPSPFAPALWSATRSGEPAGTGLANASHHSGQAMAHCSCADQRMLTGSSRCRRRPVFPEGQDACCAVGRNSCCCTAKPLAVFGVAKPFVKLAKQLTSARTSNPRQDCRDGAVTPFARQCTVAQLSPSETLARV